ATALPGAVPTVEAPIIQESAAETVDRKALAAVGIPSRPLTDSERIQGLEGWTFYVQMDTDAHVAEGRLSGKAVRDVLELYRGMYSTQPGQPQSPQAINATKLQIRQAIESAADAYLQNHPVGPNAKL